MSKDIGRVPQAAPGSREPSPDGLGPSGFDPSRVKYKRAIYFFPGPNITRTIPLPDGFRFLFLLRGHSPSVPPITEPGRYEISPELLPDGEWPICVTTCDLADVAIMEAIPSERVTEMIDTIAAYYRDSDRNPKGRDNADWPGAEHESAGPEGIARKDPS